MYALKRMAAYAIDYAVILIPTLALLAPTDISVGNRVPMRIRPHLSLMTGSVSFVVPILILGVLTGLTGRTPGKFIMFLKVQDHAGDPPGIAHGIVREVVKAVSLGLVFGVFYALRAIVTKERTFYDEWLNLDVEDLRPSGLTPTQRNFRKYMREKQRRESRNR